LLYLGSIGLIGGVTADLFFAAAFCCSVSQVSKWTRHSVSTTATPRLALCGSSANAENETLFGGDFPVLSNQLHAVGPAVNFAADAVEPLTPR
jgi:hypothetical protein